MAGRRQGPVERDLRSIVVWAQVAIDALADGRLSDLRVASRRVRALGESVSDVVEAE